MSDIAAFLEIVSEISLQGLEAIASQFSYQGFSPEMVLRHFVKVKEANGISNSEFLADLKVMLVVGVVMGNYNEHNSRRITDEGKEKMDAIYIKYKLKKGGVGSDKKAITLPRIVATFPILVAKIALQIGPKNYNNFFNCNGLPPVMKLTVFPSLIPNALKKQSYAFLMYASICFTTEQSLVLSKRTDVETVFNEQKNFAVISSQSSMPKQQERIRFFKTLKFDYDALLSVISALNNKLPTIKANVVEREDLKAALLALDE